MASTSISIYKNIHDTKGRETIHLETFLLGVQSGKWEDQVHAIRLIKEHSARQEAKKKLPYVTISGVFNEGRSNTGLSLHSGVLSMDLDGLGSDLEGVRTLLSGDPYVYACFASASGTGLCVLFRIDPERHRDAFDGIADYLIKQYQLIIDPSGKDVSRPRYVSYDPNIYISQVPLLFKKYLPKPKKRKIKASIYVQSEFDNVVEQMVAKSVSCVDDYRDWITIGFGLADQFGEAGRGYFHRLSSVSSKYESSMCDRQYTHCLRGNGKDGAKITIATIYWFAREAGIQITSQRTNHIASAASTLKRSGLDADGIAKSLAKFEGITGADDIIKQAFASDFDFSEGGTLVENIKMWVRMNYTLRRNEITRKLENGGKIIDEIFLNTMFLDCKNIFDDTNFDLFCKILFSNNTPGYNPFTDFIAANIEYPYNNEIPRLWATIDSDDNERMELFGTKWLVSIIASIYGTHSPLMLILAGPQGTGKTQVFRRLLPDELRPYYAESKLDAGKDDEILMTQKLIIMDDEMGGKNKKESKRLKDLTSKQTFTLREPYGKMNVDLNRISVLCGTTNDIEILNDVTGNRRLLPVLVNGVDYPVYNSIDKTALFMELYRMYKDGYDWELSARDVTRLRESSEKFEEYSTEYELINQYYTPANVGGIELTATQIKVNLETKSNQKLSLRKIGQELKRMGFICKMKRIDMRPCQVYTVNETGFTGPVISEDLNDLPF